MANQTPICGDHALLLWYAAGGLGEGDADRVERHVAQCHDCRAVVEENRELAQLYLSVAGSPHLSPEVLVQMASSGGTSVGGDAQAHLRECAECQQILSIVKKVQQDETGRSGAWERLASGVQSFGAGIASAAWLRSPVPAYLLALVLLYPAYRGLVGGGPDQEPHLLSAPVPIASDAERGGGETSLRVESESEQTILTVFVPIASERYRYQLELRTQEGRRIFFTEDARSFDGVGTFALAVPRDALGPGSYELWIGEWARDGGEMVNEYDFPFSVDEQ